MSRGPDTLGSMLTTLRAVKDNPGERRLMSEGPFFAARTLGFLVFTNVDGKTGVAQLTEKGEAYLSERAAPG